MVTANRGPSANPNVPADTKNDIASALRSASVLASTAACGWYAAAPSPPTMSSAISAPKLGAAPTLLRNRAEHSGPKATNHGRRRRSENQPNNG